MRILAAPDKFRGTATAAEVADAIAMAARDLGHMAETLPMADGGEGTLEALGGATEVSMVTGPDGIPREAHWRLSEGAAVIEMARASGLALLPRGTNNPLTATSAGTGELIREAFDRRARTVIVTMGGSATTDGGMGAINEMGRIPSGAQLIVVCDVETRFKDAARDFGPQKGASPEQVAELTERLEDLEAEYLDRFGVDIGDTVGSGAAGGLAGALLAAGGSLHRGFDYVAGMLNLDAAIERADIVLTGEGLLDSQSFKGKVVGGVAARARMRGVSIAAVVGSVAPGFATPIPARSLVETVGPAAAMEETISAVREAATLVITDLTQAHGQNPQLPRRTPAKAKRLPA
ncbi:glycerate kinase [Arthrobacter ulcerisalmonis]|nr:glycerate kinase [Arthrobacter ulcerisalmonis]MDQ0662541.1 glycerate kinase [Arthrobacter ulcerisalmonis]